LEPLVGRNYFFKISRVREKTLFNINFYLKQPGHAAGRLRPREKEKTQTGYYP
jgi:hypothetical protein